MEPMSPLRASRSCRRSCRSATSCPITRNRLLRNTAGYRPSTQGQSMDAQSLIAIDTAALPWEERFNDKLGRALYRKNLITDPDTGMEVRLVRYPAGVINVRHPHPCAHGMYVL